MIRNIGGRVTTPAAIRTLALLAAIARSSGTQPGAGGNLIVIHHTDCGTTRLLDYPDGLAAELGTSPDALDRDSITDPRVSFTVDFARLRANPVLPPGLIISGLLSNTDTGRLETVVAPFRAQRAAIGAPDSRIVTTPVTKPCSRSAWSSTRVR